MKPITVLKELDLICWPTLFVGFQKGWASKSDIANYATELLSKDLDHGNENIAVLASANSYSDAEVKEIILHVTEDSNLEAENNKWRLAKLLTLNELDLPGQEKLDKLQELYAAFDYPEDMTSCGIYSQDSVDPLVAMKEVITELKEKFR